MAARHQTGEALTTIIGRRMRLLLPDPLVGAFAGFGLGFLTVFPLTSLGVDLSGWPAVGLGICGAIVGGVVGKFRQGPEGRARTVAWWCATMTVVVGVISFLVGFAGPIILHPDLPQGPLLGIFFTGPLGALAGAVLGTLVGLLVPVAPVEQEKSGTLEPPATNVR
jgi:hypothetical protein